MKMKQLLTLTLAAAMVAGTSLTVGAATPGFNPPAQEDNDLTFDASQQTSEETEIPVYGYVGPDAVLIDPDPTDPNEKPDPTDPDKDVKYEINVSVPVKILWAVFEDDMDKSGSGLGIGTVTSPDYYIRNNSEQLAVSITADSFEARTGANGIDNTYVDPNWTEALTITSQNSLMKRSVALGKTNVTLGNLQPEEQMEFDVQGKLNVDSVDDDYAAANSASIMDNKYNNALQPQYDLVLTIKAL